jgi:pheromone shutdown protein TraB
MFDESDPRITEDYVRRFPGTEGDHDLVVTGTVHDHPASKHRVRSIVEAVDPDVLALELPPLAVPLFEQYAAEQSPPADGGEMSVAIDAASTETVVGVDGPTPGFVGRLVRNLYREEADLATARTVLESFASVSRHALACRIAAAFDNPDFLRDAVDSSVAHESSEDDTPRHQAEDERVQIRQARSVLSAFGKPSSEHIRDDTREAHMADRLAGLRREGAVVAVVGMGHLDPLADRLD